LAIAIVRMLVGIELRLNHIFKFVREDVQSHLEGNHLYVSFSPFVTMIVIVLVFGDVARIAILDLALRPAPGIIYQYSYMKNRISTPRHGQAEIP
jgi:hypothetical protein